MLDKIEQSKEREYKNTEYRIAYRIVEDKSRIEIVLVKTRESFYQILKRLIKDEKKLR